MSQNCVSRIPLPLKLSTDINLYLGFVASVGAVLLLAACSETGLSGPSDAEAKAAYPFYEGMAAPIDFQKKNGESLTKNGQKFYIYHFQQANPLKGAAWYICDSKMRFSPRPFIDCTTKATGAAANALVVSKGTITFKETENGWVAVAGEISDAGYCVSKEKLAGCYQNDMEPDPYPFRKTQRY